MDVSIFLISAHLAKLCNISYVNYRTCLQSVGLCGLTGDEPGQVDLILPPVRARYFT